MNTRLKHLRFASFLFLVGLLFLISNVAEGIVLHASDNEENATVLVPCNSYELDDTNPDYSYEASDKVAQMSYGKACLGSLSLTSKTLDLGSFRGVTAYAVSQTVAFSYDYDGSLQTDVLEDWNLRDDTNQKIREYDLGGSIQKGCMIIEKSRDRQIWELVGNPITNYYADNKTGTKDFYITSSEDMDAGTFYRVTFSYLTGQKIGVTGWWLWEEPVFANKKNVEEYEFFLVNDNIPVVFSDNSSKVSEYDLGDGALIEMAKHSATLIDGATTTDGFTLQKNNLQRVVLISKNGGAETIAEDGQSFTADGRYDITCIGLIGNQTTQSIFVFSGGEDHGFSDYFGESPIDGHRIFDASSTYPIYAVGTRFVLKEIPATIPYLRGEIVNLNTEERIVLEEGNRSAKSYALTPGTYQAIFTNGLDSAGTNYYYRFIFVVSNYNSQPRINYENLMNSERLCDLASKHYEVAYQTTAGGYIFVCFSLQSYDDAFAYAYEIERRFIENGYYKSVDNPNVKVKYTDPFELTAALNYYAKKNVEYAYFSAIDDYTYRTLDDSSLEALEELSVSKSIRVFPDEEQRKKCLDPMPYLNGFTFIRVADYESQSVKAYCHRNGKTYDIDYGVDVSLQLTTSSKYTITETNKYGTSSVYDAYYVAESQARSEWTAFNGETVSTVTASSYDLIENKIEISADMVCLNSAYDAWDANSVVTISAPGVYSFEIRCLIGEFSNAVFYKKGDYNVVFSDRVGNGYTVTFHISGNYGYDTIVSKIEGGLLYTDLYNSLYLNSLPRDQEIRYGRFDLAAALEVSVDENDYTESSYEVYSAARTQAQSVMDNSHSSSESVNDATIALYEAINQLIFKDTSLFFKSRIDLFESLFIDEYTSVSVGPLIEAYNSLKKLNNAEDVSFEEANLAIERFDYCYSRLVKRGDMSSLIALLASAQTELSGNYTPATLQALRVAYSAASAFAQSTDHSQEEIDAQVAKLEAALHGLKAVADCAELDETIARASALSENDYTKASFGDLKEALEAAKKVRQDENATQSEVDAALNRLKNAESALVKAGDLTILEEYLSEAFVEYYLYSSDDSALIRAICSEVEEAIENRASEQVINNLLKKMDELKATCVPSAEKLVLKSNIVAAQAVDRDLYTSESYSELLVAIIEAERVLKNVDATSEEISNANARLSKAKDALVAKESSQSFFRVDNWVLWVIAGGALLLLIIVIAIVKGIVG